MINDNEANDANDNGEELFVGLPETERQEPLRQRREVQREITLLRQERDWLLLERQVDNDKCCCWNSDDCSRSKSSNDISFKMMLMLA